MEITLKDVWKHYNTSTVMLLPLFNNIYKGIKSTGRSNVEYTFVQLCFEYGLINTYLYKEEDQYFLVLKFNVDKVNTDNKLTKSSYYSFNDLIIDVDEFSYVRHPNKDEVLYYLKIDKRLNNDIELIKESRYSETSEMFKEAVRVKAEKVSKTSNETGMFLSVNNLSYSICQKHKLIKEQLEHVIGRRLDHSAELYTKFDPEKEELHEHGQGKLLRDTGVNNTKV